MKNVQQCARNKNRRAPDSDVAFPGYRGGVRNKAVPRKNRGRRHDSSTDVDWKAFAGDTTMFRLRQFKPGVHEAILLPLHHRTNGCLAT